MPQKLKVQGPVTLEEIQTARKTHPDPHDNDTKLEPSNDDGITPFPIPPSWIRSDRVRRFVGFWLGLGFVGFCLWLPFKYLLFFCLCCWLLVVGQKAIEERKARKRTETERKQKADKEEAEIKQKYERWRAVRDRGE